MRASNRVVRPSEGLRVLLERAAEGAPAQRRRLHDELRMDGRGLLGAERQVLLHLAVPSRLSSALSLIVVIIIVSVIVVIVSGSSSIAIIIIIIIISIIIVIDLLVVRPLEGVDGVLRGFLHVAGALDDLLAHGVELVVSRLTDLNVLTR